MTYEGSPQQQRDKRQQQLEKSDTRNADAWLAKLKARDPERVKAVFAKYAVLNDEQDRQLRRDARLPADTVPWDVTEEKAADGDESRSRDLSASVAEVPWIPTATATEILRGRRLVSDEDLLRRFLMAGPKREADVKAQFPSWSDRRLKTTKASAKVKSRRIGFGAGSHVVWELP
jgi:hypothetical protein